MRTNDPQIPLLTLTLKATVKPLPAYIKRITTANIGVGENLSGFNVWPTAHAQLKMARGERLSLLVRIKPHEQNSGECIPVDARDEFIKYKIQKENETAIRWLEIEIGPISEPGKHVKVIQIPVSRGQRDSLSFELTINVLSENYMINPKELDLGTTSLQEISKAPSQAYRLAIRKEVGEFHIKQITSSIPFLELKLNTVLEGQIYIVNVIIPALKKQRPDNYSGFIEINTDDPDRQIITVPCKVTLIK